MFGRVVNSNFTNIQNSEIRRIGFLIENVEKPVSCPHPINMLSTTARGANLLLVTRL